MKQDLIGQLEQTHEKLEEIQKSVKQANTVLLNPSLVGDDVQLIVTKWTDVIEPGLKQFPAIAGTTVTSYRSNLSKLFKLTSKRNKSSSVLAVLKTILKSFKHDLVQPVVFSSEVDASKTISDLIATIPYPDQKGYLKEALDCLNAGCKRATAVLGWCAAMHHIHTKIEELGFDVFNKKAEELAKKTKGPIKLSRPIAPVESISDLREIPDRIVLTVLDGLNVIERNQRQRLEYCLDMRIQASHPGDADVTIPNLESFFSDLNQLVFANPKLTV